jgi:hypothetical protein
MVTPFAGVTRAGSRRRVRSGFRPGRGHVQRRAVPERYAIPRWLWQNCRWSSALSARADDW